MLVVTQEREAEDAVVELWLPDGRTIEVELVSVRSDDRARIGYTAPPDVRVYRRSVANSIRRQGNHPALVSNHVRVPGHAPILGTADASGKLPPQAVSEPRP